MPCRRPTDRRNRPAAPAWESLGLERSDDAEFAIDRVGRRQQLARRLAASFNTDSLAATIGSALDGTSLTALKEKLVATQQSAENVLASLHLPHLPTRNEIRSRATAMFAGPRRSTTSSIRRIA
jgi:hypothetical protein